MSTSDEILKLLRLQYQERKHQQLLDFLGYANPKDHLFGLNQWTDLLCSRSNQTGKDNTLNDENQQRYFISYLSIPSPIEVEEVINTNDLDFRKWVSSYHWHQFPWENAPFNPAQPRASHDGLILYDWIHRREEACLNKFLLIRRNGVVEFGLGQEILHSGLDEVIFKFISIVGRFWQFLGLLGDLYKEWYPRPNHISVYINMIGTQGALLGNLAEGWKGPYQNEFDSYRPKCFTERFQINGIFPPESLTTDVDNIVRWFATRIDNAWGEFEPRCYVHQKVDESKPFARR